MDREKYNSCLAEGLKGKTLSKEERKSEFCIQAKICSGKASSRSEAEKKCAERVDKNTADIDVSTCPALLSDVVNQRIDVITLAMKSGDLKEVSPVIEQTLSDVVACRPDLKDFTNDVFKGINSMSGRYYFKGEIRDAIDNLKLLAALLNNEG
ncbi:MAG: hypothetical protein WC455_22010 [Dehalococcoidia bacterium]|jgi:hypothetical protein